jgi:cytochrome c553
MLLIAVMCGSSAHAADVAAGKEKAALCIGCHGEGGISQIENIPSLAGQPDQFIQWQLVFFRAGTRKNEQMQPIVEQINNHDIRNLGAYFAALTPPRLQNPTTIPIYPRRAHGCRGTALRFVPHHSATPEQSGRASLANARNTCSKRCTTTSQACDPAAAWQRWLMSPTP